MDRILTYGIYFIYSSAVWLQNTGCTNTRTHGARMSFDCFQKLIVKGTHSSNRLYWDAEASAKVPRKGRERLLVICFPFTGYLMAFTASAYPFPHLVLKQFSVSLTSRKGVSEQIFGEKKKKKVLCFTPCISLQAGLYGAINSKFPLKQWVRFVRVCASTQWQSQRCFWKQDKVTCEVAVVGYWTQ